KYRAREYIEKKGYGDCLPKLYQVHDRVDQIDFDALPDAFAIKCNNGCGTNIFIPDKSKMDKEAVLAEGKTWNEVNTIAVGREWAYMNIEPKVVVEELLVASDEAQKGSLYDYKILCFNGTPRVIWVDVDRHIGHKRAFFDTSWNKLDVLSNYPPIDYQLPKPYGLEQMLAIASDISRDFPFIRVDFYSLNQKVYIGELTMYPFSGCVQFKPDSFDFELGSYFELPKKTIVK
ncbi:MAG: ATP-dependent carboxylate-amine ligase, partial [Kiritimatiellae bacterium]|nr:ATP-dependent carboxylate-amine ligase [Kiritimatiellia bacterium]